MNKETCIDRKKQQAAQKYTGGIQKGRSPKKDQKHEKKKKTPNPKNTYLYPNQVKNSKILLSLTPLDTLAQDHKLHMKEFFNLFKENVSLSKTTLFLSHHTVQKRHRGAALHTLLRFLPTFVPCQARRTCRTEDGKTHSTPTIAKIRTQSILAFEHCTRRWFRDSSSSSNLFT